MELQVKPKDLLNLGKQDLQMQGCDHARALMETGDHSPVKLIVQARKISEFLGSFVREIESEAIGALDTNKEDGVVFGSKVAIGSTGDRIDYKEDPIYMEMFNDLAGRATLLKTARGMKDPIFDADGVEVPKVGLTSVSRHVLKVSL